LSARSPTGGPGRPIQCHHGARGGFGGQNMQRRPPRAPADGVRPNNLLLVSSWYHAVTESWLAGAPCID
jgi:hypothetical protein